MKNNENLLLIRVIKLLLGFVVIGLGNSLMLKSDLGMNAWATLDHGISILLGISFGKASIAVGLVIIVLDMIMGMIPGLGTVLNMLTIGIFTDMFTDLLKNVIFQSYISRLVFLVIGAVICAIGVGYYITIKLGTGPRDGFSILTSRLANVEFKKLRIGLELLWIAIGYFLGATVGVGTVISALVSGPIIGRTMDFFNYNPATEIQENILDTFKLNRN